MLTVQKILEVAEEQHRWMADVTGKGFLRRNSKNAPGIAREKFARIVTGIRRCGKSTIIKQHLLDAAPESFYLNFDDPRLYGFSAAGFELVDLAIENWESAHGKSACLFFDEIQNAEGWETYISRKLDARRLVYITGSNASLLASELGTRLTGRHLDTVIYPFSFQEYLSLTRRTASAQSVMSYLADGGFPEYLKHRDPEILLRLFDDILTRDIVTRHGIRDIRSLRILAAALMENTGNLISAGKLARQFGIKTPATVLEYLSHFESAYLFATVPKFSYSAKVRAVNPRKIYSIDTGLSHAMSSRNSVNTGALLETAVFNRLRRDWPEIAYFNDGRCKCDFVCGLSATPEIALQVCAKLTAENMRREVEGAVAAAKAFPGITPQIITLNQHDLVIEDSVRIKIIPAHQFL